jgi:hypothetical protein
VLTTTPGPADDAEEPEAPVDADGRVDEVDGSVRVEVAADDEGAVDPVDPGPDPDSEPEADELVPDEPCVDEEFEPGVSARATPWPVATAAPTPKATANAPTRPTYAATPIVPPPSVDSLQRKLSRW